MTILSIFGEYMFKRKIYEKLVEWKKETSGKNALLIEGVRRIGKSTVARHERADTGLFV